MFDYTIQFNGGGRLPADPFENASVTGSDQRFDSYTIMNAQVTKYFRIWSIYVGSENLTDFKQKNPIDSADNPWGPQFSATNIWGPTMGRKVYVGLRFNLNHK